MSPDGLDRWLVTRHSSDRDRDSELTSFKVDVAVITTMVQLVFVGQRNLVW